MKNISDYESSYSVNPLYLIIDKVNGYIEESNGNKYLILASADKTKEVLTKYTELWDGVTIWFDGIDWEGLEKISWK